MTNKEYRKHEGISKSDLFKISISPLHFKFFLEAEEKPDTPALIFGRAAHKYILEKTDFYNEFAVAPTADRRTKEGKAAYAEFCEQNAGKEIISADDLEIIQAMDKAIDANKIAKSILRRKSNKYEQSYFWTDSMTGEKCKCRPDCLSKIKGKNYIVDYKTTDSCEDGHFEKACRKYGYKLQAGMYHEGMLNNTFDDYGFIFIAQEKTEPYAVRVYVCSPEYINQGIDQFRELIGLYHECKTTKNWYGYEGRDNSVTVLNEEEF